MLIAAAVCPHPPLLIPASLGGPSEPLAPVLDACDRAVRGLLAAGPDVIAVVGGGSQTTEYAAKAAGSLRPFGIDMTVGEGEPVLPVPLTVGRWLLDRVGVPSGVPVVLQAVHQRAPSADCQKLGVALAERSPRIALLAMGDASARRAHGAPGAPDPQAREYDDEVAEALAAADARWLGKLDPAFDVELSVAGRAAWQVLAGAAAGCRFNGRLLCMAAPYGVTYLVAAWDEPQAG